jgi:universal stress protein F
MASNIFNRIVVPIDLSSKYPIDSVINMALNFAVNYSAKLYFIHIIPDVGRKMFEDFLPNNFVRKQKENYDKQMNMLIKKYIPEERKVEYKIESGSIYDKIIQYSNDIKADLIIVSAVTLQKKDYNLGSNASKVIRHAGVSVLVVRDE